MACIAKIHGEQYDTQAEYKSAADLLAMAEATEIPFDSPRFGDNCLTILEQELLAAAKGPSIELPVDEIRRRV